MSKPVLFLDVDGVLCPWGDPPPGFRIHYYGKDSDYFNMQHRDWILELAELYDIMWCTGRDLDVLSTVAPCLGLPPFPVIEFSTARLIPNSLKREHIIVPHVPSYKGGTWKMPWILNRCAADLAGRSVAWIDDYLREDTYDWAVKRLEDEGLTTLLVQPDSNTGMEEIHFTLLRQWAQSEQPSQPEARP